MKKRMTVSTEVEKDMHIVLHGNVILTILINNCRWNGLV